MFPLFFFYLTQFVHSVYLFSIFSPFQSLDQTEYILIYFLPSFRTLDLAAGDVIKFGIESKFSSPETSTEMFEDVLFEVLREMKGLFLVSSPSSSSSPSSNSLSTCESTSGVVKARL